MALERKYSAEVKAEALAMVDELRRADPGDRSAVRATAAALGVGEQSLRAWLKARERRRSGARASGGSAVPGAAEGCSTTEELEHELAYLRGECARLRAAISALISP